MPNDNEDRFEQLLRVSASHEEVWRCGVCGKDRLYRNVETGNWFCHPCGVGGHHTFFNSYAHARGFTMKPFLATPTFTNSTLQLLSQRNPLLMSNPRARESLEAARIGATRHGTCCLPMRDLKGLCGLHVWEPHTTVPYRTVGLRGVTCPHVAPSASAILFEGFFDYLSFFLAYPGPLQPHIPLFVAGSTLDYAQLEYLRYLNPHHLFIAFDNDKTAPLVKALEHFPTATLCLPPQHLGKDWDDVWTLDPNFYRRFWGRVLA